MKNNSLNQQPEATQQQLLGVDIGNDWITINHKHRQINIQNTLLIEHNNAYINKKPNTLCLVDTLTFLGSKYDDKITQNNMKYYNILLQPTNNKNILVQYQNQQFTIELYLELAVALLIKGIIHTNPTLRFLINDNKNIKIVTTVFQGKLNPHRIAIKECFSLAGLEQCFLVNSNACLAANYLTINHKDKDETEIIAVVDFGSQGMTFSIHKLYHTHPGVIETLYYNISHLGGRMITHLLVDYVVQQLVKQKGMDISKSKPHMNKLKLLCDEAKQMLSKNDKAFIRLDGLPDILVYGCEVTLQCFENRINQVIKTNINIINNGLNSKEYQVQKLLLTGGSSKIPLFRKLLEKTTSNIFIDECSKAQISNGLLYIKSQEIKIIDICPFEIRMEGDEHLSAQLVTKGEQIPFRIAHKLKFPSGEFNFSLKFYQNNQLIATCFIPERPRENTFNLYLQVDHNKMINIFGTTSQGLIKMSVNMMSLPKQRYLQYQKQLNKTDFHIEND